MNRQNFHELFWCSDHVNFSPGLSGLLPWPFVAWMSTSFESWSFCTIEHTPPEHAAMNVLIPVGSETETTRSVRFHTIVPPHLKTQPLIEFRTVCVGCGHRIGFGGHTSFRHQRQVWVVLHQDVHRTLVAIQRWRWAGPQDERAGYKRSVVWELARRKTGRLRSEVECRAAFDAHLTSKVDCRAPFEARWVATQCVHVDLWHEVSKQSWYYK